MNCPVCQRRVKNLKLHLKAGHHDELEKVFVAQPEARAVFEKATSEEIAEFLNAAGFPPREPPPDAEAAVIKAVQTIVGKIDFRGLIQKEVASQLQLLVEGQQQSPQQSTPGQPQQMSHAQTTILNALAQRLAGGGDLHGMIELQKAMATIANLYLQPQQQARLDAFKEMNEILKLARGVGSSPEQTGEIGETWAKKQSKA